MAETQARLRSRWWYGWVWLVPLGAVAIVLWLGGRWLADRGPDITISFRNVEGLLPGQTKIQHRNVDLGTVEALQLSPDMSRVIVHARMRRAAAAYLTENARFAIIEPRVGFGGISGLSTIVSGSYIEMYPGQPGPPKTDFVGLDEPPVLTPDARGRTYVLTAPDLGSLTRGSAISYRGVAIGEVEDYLLLPDGKGVRISAFVRSPHEDLVHPETRFWNAGGVDLTVGAQGVRIRATSWQQLLSGGIAFDTPQQALAGGPSPENAEFRLYEDRRAAQRAPLDAPLEYVADFAGNQRGLDPGTAVELQGEDVGEVTESHLTYDTEKHTLLTRAAFIIDPERVAIQNLARTMGTDQKETVRRWIEKLVGDGLRAQVSSYSLLTGTKIVSLEMVENAPRAHIDRQGELSRLPSSAAADFTAVVQNLQGVLKNLDRATAGPQLGHALQSLDDTLTRLDQITREVQPDIKMLIGSLRDTTDAAQNTLNTVQGVMGDPAARGSDLPRLLRELTEAARSVRGLADYLDRHPEALLRGRKGGDR